MIADAFTAYHSDLVRFCASRLGAAASEAEDVAMSAWLAALTAPYEDRGRLRSYVFTIARNRIIDIARSRRASEVPIPPPHDARHPRCAIDEARVMTHVDLTATRALLRLSPRRRRVLWLRYVEERSLDETGQALGIGRWGARALQRAALKEVRG